MGLFDDVENFGKKYGPPALKAPSGGRGDASFWEKGRTYGMGRIGMGSNYLAYDPNDPFNVKAGKYKYDLRDPRILLGTLNPMLWPVAAYGFGRQYETYKNDDRLEKQYKPQAQANANLA